MDGEEAYPYRARAFVKIQDGCDNRCTFCVIPSVRGGCRSIPLDEAVRRIQELTADGFREIVLAGIHLSSYGEDLAGTDAGSGPSVRKTAVTLADLLRKIEKVPGLGRVRLSSLDPRKTDDAFIEYVAGNPVVCQHFHLSLQHASMTILRKMGRLGPATDTCQGPALYESLLSRLRERSPEGAIGADIIVGFPGETDEDFAILEAFLERSPLSYFHVFSYSPRRGTPAASWPQVPETVKSARAKQLRRLSAAKNLEFRRSLGGKDLDAIVISTRGNGFAELLTGNYVRVSVPSCPASRRDLVRVRIARVLPGRTEGTLV